MSSSAPKGSANPNFAVVLLAAGTSSRLGRPKQLLPYKGSTLIRERVDTIHEAFPELEQLIVVTGANREGVLEALHGTNFKEAFNASFESGMGSSVKAGVRALLPDTKAAFFLLADQPFVLTKHLKEMITLWRKYQQNIVAAAYSDIVGVPAIFPEQTFPNLLELEGDAGARKVIARLCEKVVTYQLPEAEVDIDLERDIKVLNE